MRQLRLEHPVGVGRRSTSVGKAFWERGGFQALAMSHSKAKKTIETGPNRR